MEKVCVGLVKSSVIQSRMATNYKKDKGICIDDASLPEN